MVVIGEKFGRWTVIQPPEGGRRVRAICQCECGTVRKHRVDSLRSGQTKGCRECYYKVLRAKTTKTHPKWKGYEGITGTHWASIMHDAQRRKLPFEITIEYAWELVKAQKFSCPFTKTGLLFGINRTASLDRIDSSKGYVVGNVQWVHVTINFMKGSLSDVEFIDWCHAVARARPLF